MRKLLLTTLALCLICSLFGCSLGQNVTEGNTTNTIEPSTNESATIAENIRQEALYAVCLPIVSEESLADDSTTLFRHTYQNISLTLPDPAVADKVIVDYLNRTDLHDTAAALRDAAANVYKSGSAESLPYLLECSYTPMRMDSGILSLFGKTASYAGAAHVEETANAVTYDLLTGNALTWEDILCDGVKADVLQQMIADALATDSELTLFAEYKTILKDIFSGGFPQSNDWYLDSEGLCCFFSPYEIGPFSSGTVLAKIPYSKLTGVLKDAYFPAEAQTVSGTLLKLDFKDADLDAYTQFIELTTDASGEKFILTADNAVRDITISQESPQVGGTVTHTIFRGNFLSWQSGIVIQTNNPTQLKVTYTAGQERITEAFK